MASVIKVGDKWRAQVRRRNHKPQTRTFRLKSEAEAWAREVESKIDAGQEPKSASLVRVREVIAAYRQLREDGGRPIDPASNQSYMVKHLEDDLGHERVADLSPQRLVEWAGMRKEQGAGPYTVNMELSALGTMLRHASAYMNTSLPDVTGAARPLLLHLQLIGAGNRRERVPTEDELRAVLEWVHARNTIVADAMKVAAITGLRRSEVAGKLLWADLDESKRAALIRQRKHPRRHLARDEWVPLLGEAWDIVQRQARTDDRVFPVTLEKMTDSFTAAAKALSIPNLHLHDLRHYASTMLQQVGFDDVERMAITGHKSVPMNARYTHPSPEHLHAKFEAGSKKKRPAKKRAKAAA